MKLERHNKICNCSLNNIKNAASLWKKIQQMSEATSTMFIAPNGSIFRNVQQIKQFFFVMSGGLCGLDNFVKELEIMPVTRVESESQFDELHLEMIRNNQSRFYIKPENSMENSICDSIPGNDVVTSPYFKPSCTSKSTSPITSKDEEEANGVKYYDIIDGNEQEYMLVNESEGPCAESTCDINLVERTKSDLPQTSVKLNNQKLTEGETNENKPSACAISSKINFSVESNFSPNFSKQTPLTESSFAIQLQDTNVDEIPVAFTKADNVIYRNAIPLLESEDIPLSEVSFHLKNDSPECTLRLSPEDNISLSEITISPYPLLKMFSIVVEPLQIPPSVICKDKDEVNSDETVHESEYELVQQDIDQKEKVVSLKVGNSFKNISSEIESPKAPCEPELKIPPTGNIPCERLGCKRKKHTTKGTNNKCNCCIDLRKVTVSLRNCSPGGYNIKRKACSNGRLSYRRSHDLSLVKHQRFRLPSHGDFFETDTEDPSTEEEQLDNSSKVTNETSPCTPKTKTLVEVQVKRIPEAIENAYVTRSPDEIVGLLPEGKVKASTPKLNPNRKKSSVRRSPYFKDKNSQPNSESVSIRGSYKKRNPGNTVIGPRGLHETIDYNPPSSPYNLIQEQLYSKPWQLLVATIFLNKTTGLAAIPVFWQFMIKYGSPQKTLEVGWKIIADLMKPLGLNERRAKNIIRFSEEYLNKPWKYPIELYGIGKYGDDSYRIFCLGQWKEVSPDDHKLKMYHSWISQQDRLGFAK